MYQIEVEQWPAYEAWSMEHDQVCPHFDDGKSPISKSGDIGGRLTFSFTPTSLGVVTVVKCACGAEVNLTDYESW